MAGGILSPQAALARADELAKNGADIIDLGAASSNPDGKAVAADIEIARLAPVVAALRAKGVPVSVDTFSPEVQLWALKQGVDYLNDVQGFRHPEIYERLAAAGASLIVMHAVQDGARAERIAVSPADIVDRVLTFFGRRLPLLEAAGIARERLILDPGMGFFLGTDPEASYEVLRHLGTLKEAFSPAGPGLGVPEVLPAEDHRERRPGRPVRQRWRRNCLQPRRGQTISAPTSRER